MQKFSMTRLFDHLLVHISDSSVLMWLPSVQADADSFYTACNGRQFNSIEDAVCQLVYVERAEVIKSEEVRLGLYPEARVSSCL